MIKILILSDDFPPSHRGGAGIIAFKLAKALQEAGHIVGVITTTQEKEQEAQTKYENLKVWRVYANYHERWRAYLSLYNPQTIKKVQEIINDFGPNVVHAHNLHYYLSYHCLRLAKQSGAKVFLTAHDVMLFHYGKLIEFINPNNLSCPDMFDYRVSTWQQIKRFRKRYNPFRNIIIRRYLKYVDKIFAVSNALKDALNQNGIQNVEVIHNGIDVNDWRINASLVENFKEKYNLYDRKVILFGGRLSEAKGGGQVVLAMEKVINRVPKAVMLVAGDKNEYAKEMIKIAKEKGIEKHLLFTGWLSGDELKSAYHSSDAVIVPSICFDSFPTVILEAFAAGKPVVASCFGGAREIVRDGENGYIVNPLKVSSLTEVISGLIINQEKNRLFGQAGRHLILERYSINTVAKNYLSFFSE